MKLNSILPVLAVCIGLASQAAHAAVTSCQPNRLPSNPDTAYTLPLTDDGTVTHAPTGLTWKRCSEGQSWSGGTCTGTETWYTWGEALAAASTSNFAGYTDWRVPNIKELRSLVEECRYYPAINDTIFPNTPDNDFWSSSPKRDNNYNNKSWAVNARSGLNQDTLRFFGIAVRLVRGGDYYDYLANSTSPAATTSLLSISGSGSGNGSITSDAGGVSCTSTAGSLWGTCSAILATGSRVTLTASPASGGTFIGWSGVCSGNATSCTVSMTAAKAVTARFSGGTPAAATVPGAPTGLTATAGDASASIAFAAPGSNGGAAINAYIASCTAGASTLTGTAPSSPITVSGMTNSTSYSCTVLAHNSVGNGTPSAAVSVLPVASTAVPGALTSLVATPGDASASIAFTAPASGGSVTSYNASCTATGATTRTATASSSPIAISGMTNGIRYSCAVLARNSFGDGPPNSISVTPAAPAPSTGCYPVTSSSESSSASAHSGSVTFTSGGVNAQGVPCPAWGATSNNPDWITVGNLAAVVNGGTVSGVVNYSVAAYTGTSLRTGTLSIGDAPFTRTYTITQYGPNGVPAPTCTLTAAPASIAAGGSSTLTASCDLAATSFVWTGDSCAGTSAASCTVTPAATASYSVAGINSTGTGAAANATVTVTAAAVSIIDHYYTNILNRGADAGGKAFWQSEVARMSNLGVSATEAYITMARYFFTSSEFITRGLSNDQFIQNLYLTFFNRSADQGGLAYWNGVLASGLPHDMVMYAFMFSPEFSSFMTQNGVSSTQRAEIGTVIDYYRGAFGRLPDDAGLKYWVNQFRSNAQCSANPTVNVYSTATSMAGGFFNGADYLAGSPTPSKYVSDLYNAFMRRTADLAGFNYWVNQLSTKAQTYDQVRQSFIDSTEFAARVQAIAGQGCTQSIQ